MGPLPSIFSDQPPPSTRRVDSTTQIDSSGAAFKFTSLQLNGSPTISTTDGEINLGLIGVNGITAAGTPGTLTTLTFAGIRGMLLATQNGSINIGAGFAFSGLHDLTFYARGAGSNLTLGAAISTTSQLTLYSEGDVNLSGNVNTRDFRSFSGGNFSLTSASFNAETISITSGTNVSLGIQRPVSHERFLSPDDWKYSGHRFAGGDAKQRRRKRRTIKHFSARRWES